MKCFSKILIMVCMIIGSVFTTTAQEKARISMAGIHEKNGEVWVTLHSSRHFIFANNKYYLHIGQSEFSRYEQAKEGHKGQIRFIIPADEAGKLPDNVPVYLTYGRVSRDGTGLDLMSKDESVPCWSLGTFDHSMIRK